VGEGGRRLAGLAISEMIVAPGSAGVWPSVCQLRVHVSGQICRVRCVSIASFSMPHPPSARPACGRHLCSCLRPPAECGLMRGYCAASSSGPAHKNNHHGCDRMYRRHCGAPMSAPGSGSDVVVAVVDGCGDVDRSGTTTAAASASVLVTPPVAPPVSHGNFSCCSWLNCCRAAAAAAAAVSCVRCSSARDEATVLPLPCARSILGTSSAWLASSKHPPGSAISTATRSCARILAWAITPIGERSPDTSSSSCFPSTAHRCVSSRSLGKQARQTRRVRRHRLVWSSPVRTAVGSGGAVATHGCR
jgi:hypothetical protein